MEDLDYWSLFARYSAKGRKGFNPIIKYAVVTYANMRRIRSVDWIVELCQRDLAFIWLTQGQKPKRDAFYDFIDNKLTDEVLEDLHYQFIRRLEKEGFVTLKALFIDGTKIEANANRYTFVWSGSLNYHLAGLLDTIDTLYARYNRLVAENDYEVKYELPAAQIFIIEGMEKIPNNTCIEIDSCSFLEILKLMTNLTKIANGEGIAFEADKGRRKPEIQKLYEELEGCGGCLMKYKECFENMGKVVDGDAHCYRCHNGRDLRHVRTEKGG